MWILQYWLVRAHTRAPQITQIHLHTRAHTDDPSGSRWQVATEATVFYSRHASLASDCEAMDEDSAGDSNDRMAKESVTVVVG